MSKQSEKEPVQHTSLTSPFRYYPSAVPDLTRFIPIHWHNEFEVNYVLSGEATFYWNGIRHVAQEGDIFVFQPNWPHGMTALEGEKIVYDTLLFSPQVFGSLDERSNHVIITPQISGEAHIQLPINSDCAGYDDIRQVTESLFAAAKSDADPAGFLVKSELLRLFYYLHTYNHIHFNQNKGSSDEARIRSVLTYIDQHFAEDLSIEMLAQLIPLSKSYLMSCFKRITGTSIVTYIIQVRIRKACEMLLTTDKQVMQIAMECGFDNLSNFIRQFKKHTECSPMKYRKAYSYTEETPNKVE